MATRTVDILKSQPQLAELLQLTAAGHDVIIVEGNKPLARLVHIESAQRKRVAGLNGGAISTSEDFDDPIPDEFEQEHRMESASRH
jgi:antitoxin (DNA-binding transcriptional repressor) of toxin-antitoxin stability system